MLISVETETVIFGTGTTPPGSALAASRTYPESRVTGSAGAGVAFDELDDEARDVDAATSFRMPSKPVRTVHLQHQWADELERISARRRPR